MPNPPNQFQPVYLVFNRQNGLTYETSLVGHGPFDTEDAARACAEDMMQRSRGYLDDGRIDGSTMFWTVRPSSYVISGFYDREKDPSVPPVRFRGIDIRPARSISDMDRDDPTAL